MENRYKRLLNNSVWNFAGNAGSKLISFLLLPFYTKWLGAEGYGFSDLITTYSSLFGGLLTLCLSDAILIFVKDKDVDSQKEYFSSAISATLVLFLIWAFLVTLFKCLFKGDYGFISNNIWFIIGMITTNFMQTSSQQMSLAINRIKVYSFSGLVLCLTIFVFSWMLIPRYGVAGYVYAMIFANVVTALYSMTFAGLWGYLSILQTNVNRIKELAYYSIPLIPNAIMWWLVAALNRPLMERILGLSSVGVFAVAQKFPAIITLLFTIFSVSWTVSVIEEYGKPSFDLFYKKIFRLTFSGIVVFSIILMLFSKEIIYLLTAPDFHDAYKYMIILIVGAFFSNISAFCGTCFSVVKKSKYFFYSSLWGAGTAIILNFLLIPRMAIYGASISVAVSFMITALARYIYSLKFVKTNLIPLIVMYTIIMMVSAVIILAVDSFLIQCITIAVCSLVVLFVERNNLSAIKVIVRNKL